ncbi:MAG: hypothetical protein ACLTYN_10605 [Dysosmobacter welbionis]
MKHTAAEGRGEENKMKTVIVDAVGEPCPIPVVKATGPAGAGRAGNAGGPGGQ